MNHPIDKQATEKKLTWEAPRLIVQELTGTEGKFQTTFETSNYGPS